MKKLWSFLNNAIFILGFVLLACGLYIISPALCMILVGIFLMFASYQLAKPTPKSRKG